MTSLLVRAVAALRVWLGMNDPSENHLHASHGWLLPPAGQLRSRALTPAVATVTVRRPAGRVR